MNRKTYARAHKVSKLNSPAIAYYADSYIRGFGHQLVAGVFMTLLSTVPHSLSRAALMISATRSLAQQKKWFRSRYPALLMITFLWLLVRIRKFMMVRNSSTSLGHLFLISNPLAESRYAMTQQMCHAMFAVTNELIFNFLRAATRNLKQVSLAAKIGRKRSAMVLSLHY